MANDDSQQQEQQSQEEQEETQQQQQQQLAVLNVLDTFTNMFSNMSQKLIQSVKLTAGHQPFMATRLLSSTAPNSTLAKSVVSLKGQNFMTIDQLSVDELKGLLDVSHHYKEIYSDKSKPLPKPLDGCSLSMIFQKRSTRTRVSTETGMFMLGGHALFLGPSDIQLGVNESMRDTACVLSRFNDLILARVYAHDDIEELGKYATVPIINALSDMHHPLQTLADLMALQQRFGMDLSGKTLCWVGDGNNVLHSLMVGCVKMGMNVQIATPTGYEPDATIMALTKQIAAENGVNVMTTTVADEAVKGSDVVVTDTWVSMGQEDEYAKRKADFDGYEVNTELMAKANDGAVFLHCLPRHVEEVTDEVIYSDASLVFPEAENRMWTVMAVMAAQMGKI